MNLPKIITRTKPIILMGISMSLLLWSACGIKGSSQGGPVSLSLWGKIKLAVGVAADTPPMPAASVQHFGQMLQNMELATGLVANSSIRAYYQAKLDVLSEKGSPSSITAPMWMAVTELSNKMCNQLVNKEQATASASRTYFMNVDFAGPITNFAAADQQAVIRRMARAFWGRNETTQEQANLLAGLTGALNVDTNPRGAVLVTCSVMLAALPARET